MELPSKQQLIDAIRWSWDDDTSSVPEQWSTENPARGQCVPSALVVQDFLGGDLERLWASGEKIAETHYRNRLDDGSIVYTTEEQYFPYAPVTFVPKKPDLAAANCKTMREYVLLNEQTNERYRKLRARVLERLSWLEK